MALWSIAAAAAASVVQPGSQVDQDLRCLAAFAQVGDMAEDESKTGFMLITMFYIGRIDAEAPDLDLEKGLTAILSDPGYDDEDLAADIERCSADMELKVQDLDRVGRALMKKGK